MISKYLDLPATKEQENQKLKVNMTYVLIGACHAKIGLKLDQKYFGHFEFFDYYFNAITSYLPFNCITNL